MATMATRAAVRWRGGRGRRPMPTPLYRFHCTDGHELVADLQGKRLPTWALMRAHAERVALDLMVGATPRDWSSWTVEIYEASGRHVLSKPFADVLVNRQARQG
ncbi:DUF6894 family protein [Methylobacterium sp. J-059]|uniref:DUF6894 family protein n=1 Tax=Methylobacterium sp. J-059 TaxID=2836643 RepID=UPI00391AD0FB